MKKKDFRVAFIANGELRPSLALKAEISTHDKIIAVDGGLLHCRAMGIIPDEIIGDGDSLPEEIKELYKAIPFKHYPRDKDFSDLELAINAEESTCQAMTVYGALGRRSDHTLYNLYLLVRYPAFLRFEGHLETIFALNQGMHVIPSFPGQTLSFFPLGNPCSGISSVGLKWELQNCTFNQNAMSLSNLCLDDSFTLEIKEGCLICCLQKGIQC